MKNKNKLIKILTDPLLLIIMALVVIIIFTWIPHNAYSGSEENILISESGRYGLFDLPIAIWFGYQQMFGTFLYVITVGFVFQLLNRYGAIELVINDIHKGVKGNKYLFTSLIFSFLFLLSSLIGFFEQFLILLPIFWISFEKVNIDKKKTTIIFILAATFGRAFSTTSPYGYPAGFDAIPSDVLELFGGQVNEMLGVRMFLMMCGYLVSITIINFMIFFENKDDINDVEETTNGQEISEMEIENRKSIYGNWFVFVIMLVIILMTSLNWESIMGSSYGTISNWINNNLFFVSGVIKPMDEWGNPEKVTVMIFVCFVMWLIFITTKSKVINDEGVVVPVIVKMLKVYSVFAISKSISLVMIYSGLAYQIASMITWKASPALFVLAMIPIIFVITFIMNSQTGALVIFTPIIAQIIGLSSFENPELVLIISMAMISLCVGINSAITPTQSLNSISIQMSEISHREYYKGVALPLVSVFVIFAIIVLPLITLI